MAKQFHLRVVTPDRTVIDRKVNYVHFTGLDGGYGILADHAALMTAIADAGSVTVENTDGTREDLFVSDGFAEMQNNNLTIVCEAGEKVAEIDPARAKAMEEKAREALAREEKMSAGAIRAEASLRKALLRDALARRGKGSSNLR